MEIKASSCLFSPSFSSFSITASARLSSFTCLYPPAPKQKERIENEGGGEDVGEETIKGRTREKQNKEKLSERIIRGSVLASCAGFREHR